MTSENTRLRRLTAIGVVIALLIAPTQYGLRLGKELHLSPVDPLIWGLFLLWTWDLIRSSGQRPIPFPPPFVLVFILIVAVSVSGPCQRMTALKEFIQLLEYFVVAYVLFLVHLSDKKLRHFMLLGFLMVATAILVVGVVQYYWLSLSPSDGFLVRGTFGNRNVFGGFLALALPLMYGLALWSRHNWQRVWLFVAILAGGSVALSGGTVVALVVALLVVSLLHGQRTALCFLAGLLLIVGLLFSWLPRENLAIARESVVLYKEDGEVSPRYTEWQAAVEMIREHPWRGVGIGNYQANIGRYYGILPRPPSKAEPDSQNLYLVIASTTGVPGLLSFLALLATFGLGALRAFHVAEEPWKKGAAAGLVGSFLAFAINSVWSPLLVRGIGVPLVWLFALSHSLSSAGESATPQRTAGPAGRD